jgi:hypothetical protein
MQVYTGIDWSESEHDIVFMNEAGAAIARDRDQVQCPYSVAPFFSARRLAQTRCQCGQTACRPGRSASNRDCSWPPEKARIGSWEFPRSVVECARPRHR